MSAMGRKRTLAECPQWVESRHYDACNYPNWGRPLDVGFHIDQDSLDLLPGGRDDPTISRARRKAKLAFGCD